MVGAQDHRLMRMLKGTSKHHQPARLAAAVALGIVVGLVPKANLLAVGLYAGLLVLPIHTWLALTVSVLVACTASYFDPLTHALGSWLLQQRTLRPLWFFLDNSVVLPWLGLHNTIVLGSLVSGVTLATPTYLLSLRLFDRLRWGASDQKRVHKRVALEETIVLAPQPAGAAIIPPSKLAGLTKGTARPVLGPADEEEFEPAREVAAIINSWHMGDAAQKSLQLQSVGAQSRPPAHTSAEQSSRSIGSTNQNSTTSEDSFRPRSFNLPPRPRQPERSEIVDSLDLAHSASEVLAWVDELLEDCLSEDSSRSVARDPHGTVVPPIANAHVVHADPLHTGPLHTGPLPAGEIKEERWLMETTIEIVRWSDAEERKPSATPTTPEASQASPTDAPKLQALQDSTSQPSCAGSAQTPLAHSLPAPVSGNEEACQSGQDNGRPGIVKFVQSGAQSKRAAQLHSESHGADATEPQRGECLGYLLGHLRQEREGRSS